jgi:hypothetical protein
VLQRYAEQSSSGTAQPSADSVVPAHSNTGLPDWRVALRRGVTTVVERALGECLAPTPTKGMLVLLAIFGLLAVITVTLSLGNALLVLLAGVIMRITCEYRGR